MKNYLSILPEEIIRYIFEFHNPYKDYYEKYIIQHLKMNNILKNKFENRNYHLTSLGLLMKTDEKDSNPFNFPAIVECMELIEKHYTLSNNINNFPIHADSGRLYLINRYKFNYEIDLPVFIIAMIMKGHNPTFLFRNGKVVKNCFFRYLIKTV